MESNEKISKALSTSYKSDVEKVKKEVKDIKLSDDKTENDFKVDNQFRFNKYLDLQNKKLSKAFKFGSKHQNSTNGYVYFVLLFGTVYIRR